jgi:hypothetical protein
MFILYRVVSFVQNISIYLLVLRIEIETVEFCIKTLNYHDVNHFVWNNQVLLC